MKIFFLKHWLKIAGVTVGAIGGYLYYYYVGCLSGTCPITSNPYRMLIYGALLGYLLFDMFSQKNSPKKVAGTTDNHEKENNNKL